MMAILMCAIVNLYLCFLGVRFVGTLLGIMMVVIESTPSVLLLSWALTQCSYEIFEELETVDLKLKELVPH